jgi:hypothetical protein
MAANSVPVFFGAKARSKNPPGLDVTYIIDLSDSRYGDYAPEVASERSVRGMEEELLSQGIGVVSPNRYSFTSGGDSGSNTLPEIEQNAIVNGLPQRWAPGANVLNDSAILPNLIAGRGESTEDIGLAANLITENDRDYMAINERIIIAASDEQSYGTPFTANPTYPHRYVGVHEVSLSINEPAGPNPVPAGGLLVGFIYTTATTGTAIYESTKLDYRLDVPVANVTATAIRGARQENIDQARLTNGAIFYIDRFEGTIVGRAIGRVLGQYLFDIS